MTELQKVAVEQLNEQHKKAKVLIYFEALKKDYNEMITAITELSAEDDKEKFTTAVYKMLQLLADNLGQEV